MRVPEGWTQTTVGELVQQFKSLNKNEKLVPLSVTKDRGVILQAEKFKKVIATGEGRNYKIIRRGEFAYDPMSLYYGAIGRLIEHESGVISPAYITFRLRPGLDPSFFGYYTKTKSFITDVNRVTTGGNIDGKRKKTSWDAFCSLSINLPPLPEQRKVAEILSSVDDTIAATRAVVEQIRKVRQGILDRLLTKGVGHSRFIETEIGAIPGTWRLKTLGELCSLTNGNGFRPPDWTDNGLPIIRIQNLNGSREFNYFAGTPKSKWIVEPGDLLFSWAGVRGVSFGPYIWNGPRGVLNQHIFKVHPSADVNRFWLYHAMRLVTARIEAKAHGFKASLLHVHKSEITGQLVAVPPENEQEEVVHRLNALSQSEQSATDSLAQLEQTKSALLSDLLTGRKRVSADALIPAA